MSFLADVKQMKAGCCSLHCAEATFYADRRSVQLNTHHLNSEHLLYIHGNAQKRFIFQSHVSRSDLSPLGEAEHNGRKGLQ